MLAHRKPQPREDLVDLTLECSQRLLASRVCEMPHTKPVMREAAARVELERLLQRALGIREQAPVQTSLTQQTLHRDAQRIERHGTLQQRDRFVVASKTRSQDRRMAKN